MSKENNERLKSIEISFGTVFEHTFEGETTKHVIVWVGKRNYCDSCAIIEGGRELEVHPLGGTTTLSEIHNVLEEKMTLDQIIKGMDIWWGKKGTPKKIIKLLKRNSKQKARILSA